MGVESGFGARCRIEFARARDLRRQRADYANATTSLSGKIIYQRRVAEIDRQIEDGRIPTPPPLSYEEARIEDLQMKADDIDDAREFLVGRPEFYARDACRFYGGKIRDIGLQIEGRFEEGYRPASSHRHFRDSQKARKQDLLNHHGWILDGLNKARREGDIESENEFEARLEELRAQLDTSFPEQDSQSNGNTTNPIDARRRDLLEHRGGYEEDIDALIDRSPEELSVRARAKQYEIGKARISEIERQMRDEPPRDHVNPPSQSLDPQEARRRDLLIHRRAVRAGLNRALRKGWEEDARELGTRLDQIQEELDVSFPVAKES